MLHVHIANAIYCDMTEHNTLTKHQTKSEVGYGVCKKSFRLSGKNPDNH